MTNIINKGTGAGGAMTNHNGLNYEDITSLDTHITVLCEETYGKGKNGKGYKVKFNENGKTFIKLCKSGLFLYMQTKNEINNIIPASGCKQPDEAFINEEDKTLFIIEKKFQQTTGSVDEKIQTGVFKKYHYSQLFNNYKIIYIYCLSDWFKKIEYSSVLKYLNENGVPIYFGSDIDYKDKITNFITS
jgi:hypothetical protein